MRISDWSSDVCSSDLPAEAEEQQLAGHALVYLQRRRGQLQLGRQRGLPGRLDRARPACTEPVGPAAGQHRAPVQGVRYLLLGLRARAQRRLQLEQRRAVQPDVLALRPPPAGNGRRAVRVRSEEHTSELQSLMRISYAVF